MRVWWYWILRLLLWNIWSCLWTFYGTSSWRETQSSYSLEAFITVASGSSTRKKRLTGTKREVNFPASVGKLVGYPLVAIELVLQSWYPRVLVTKPSVGPQIGSEGTQEETDGACDIRGPQIGSEGHRRRLAVRVTSGHFLLSFIFLLQDKLGWHSKSRISQSLSLFCLLSGEWFFNAVTHCSICLCITYL